MKAADSVSCSFCVLAFSPLVSFNVFRFLVKHLLDVWIKISNNNKWSVAEF